MIALLWALYARALDRAGSLLDTLALIWSLIAEPELYYCDTVAEVEDMIGVPECTW